MSPKVNLPRRRVLLGLAAAPSALAAYSANASTLPATGELRPQWEKAKRFALQLDAAKLPEEDLEAEMDRLWDMETAVLRAPIRTTDDALAKLECCAIMAERGMRTDWLDCEAVGEGAAFLKGTFA